MTRSNSIAAALTPGGRGAIAVIRVHGPVALLNQHFSPARGKPLEERPLRSVVFGRWGNAACEELVIRRCDELVTEIHCHGGSAAVRRILDDLASLGVRPVTWQELLLEISGVFESEWTAALARATTERTANVLLHQSQVWRDTVSVWMKESRDWTGSSRDRLHHQVREALERAEFGRHLTVPWDVVLCGRPNVGKSSLINAMAGYARSIVYDQPGTTRDAVTAETAFTGWPMRLTDTAGLRDTDDQIESTGVALALDRIRSADCRLLLLDVGCPPTAADRQLLLDWPDALRVAHKSDLPNRWGDELPGDAIAVSSVTGQGVDGLCTAIVSRLIPAPPPSDALIPFMERQTAELETASAALQNDDEGAFRGALEALL